MSGKPGELCVPWDIYCPNMNSAERNLSGRYSIIKGTGCYIPPRVVPNEEFINNVFCDNTGKCLEKSNVEILERFQAITDIKERRHITPDLVTSDIAFFAAEEALKSSGVDKESLDYIIVAHNFGDVSHENRRSDFVPTLAARVKYKLGIVNPATVAFDLPFGCPGWLQAVIQADYILRSGDANRVLVIGAEVLSRVSDPHDRDSLIYADGAGAVILEAKESNEKIGIIKHGVRSDTHSYSKMLRMGRSNSQEYTQSDLFLKMDGRKLYEYALRTVPAAIKETIDKAGYHITDINKILIHQANGKMDEAILTRLFSLYGITDIPKDIMPMTISWLGNSSVATLPTLLDLILKGKMEDHHLKKNDIVLFASVGAGMNINALVYKMV